jgi:uncharacterized protein
MRGSVDRRTFIRRAGVLAGGVALAGPLQSLAARAARGETLTGEGYGALVNMGDLWLPQGFQYRIISLQGDMMSDGNPTPSRFDGMATFPGPGNTTILIRNHENKRRFQPSGAVVSPANEIDVVVPAELRYDPNMMWNGGVVRLLVDPSRSVVDSRAVMGGTTHNCAGGPTPWGSWISCEELFQPPPGSGTLPHGFIFEVEASIEEPSAATPIMSAGRFEHEAVAWLDDVLYETEDQPGASFYRYLPATPPENTGDLAATGGALQALHIVGMPRFDTRPAGSWPGGIGSELAVDWVDIANPTPALDSMAGGGVRFQAQNQGAAIFARTEGCWSVGDKVLFDCTTGGSTSLPPNGFGQVFELDPAAGTLALVYEADPSAPSLVRPDNMSPSPRTGDLFLCEDNLGTAVPNQEPEDAGNHIRALTPDGLLFDFARAGSNPTEFCGVCFDEKGLTMYVNQQGNAADLAPGVTYAIWGPWKRQGSPH